MEKGFYNKKSGSILIGQVVMILLTIILFFFILYYIKSNANSVVLYQKIYARQIALLIDSSLPGTEIRLDFDKGFEIAQKNKIKDLASYSGNKVYVKLADIRPSEYSCLTNYDVEIKSDDVNKKLIIKVK